MRPTARDSALLVVRTLRCVGWNKAVKSDVKKKNSKKDTCHNNNRHNIVFTDRKKAGSLKCYICHSKESWQDCESKQRLEECPPQGNEVCATLQMTQSLRINGTQSHQTTYSKHCDTTEVCSLEECKRLGWLCTTNCCNQDSCNSSVTMVSNMICVIIFSFLCIL